jgi:hypothetical protein
VYFVVAVAVLLVASALATYVLRVRSLDVGPGSVTVTNTSALVNSIDSFVELSKTGHGTFQVTTRVSTLESSWRLFEVRFSDQRVAHLYGFAHWRDGQWALYDTSFHHAGCAQRSGSTVFKPLTPLRIVHSFGWHC